jgi:hypothetical protein
LEVIVQEYILNTIRESIPVETILDMYLKETVEEDVTQEVKETYVDEPISQVVPLPVVPLPAVPLQSVPLPSVPLPSVPLPSVPLPSVPLSVPLSQVQPIIKFNDVDNVKYSDNRISTEIAPKTDERLREITEMRRQMDTIDDDDKIKISDQSADINLDIQDFDMNEFPVLLDDVEILS